MKPIKNSVSVVIYNPDRSKILIVQRPFDDENLPGLAVSVSRFSSSHRISVGNFPTHRYNYF